MKSGYLLFVDEAGDEGIDKLRPQDPRGSPEYFVLAGILVSIPRYNQLRTALANARRTLSLEPNKELHFKDLEEGDKIKILKAISDMRTRYICIISNKRNMVGYRNERCERADFEIVKGRTRPKKNNWFYNNMLRYLLERATEECGRRTMRAFGQKMPIKVVMSTRKGFSYSQTKAYLRKLSVRGHDKSYFNNKHWIDWSMLDISAIEERRAKNEPGLQVADCVASAIFRSLDVSWFGDAKPEYIEILSHKFAKKSGVAEDYGFKLLPDGFDGPLNEEQSRALKAVGCNIKPTD